MTLAAARHQTSSAAPPATAEEALPDTYLTFDIAGQTFAADVAGIREILDHQHITPLPNTISDLVGMIDVRGQGLAVLDLSGRLGLAGCNGGAETRIIVVDGGPGGQTFAILADRVSTVVEIPESQIDAPPNVPGSWSPAGMTGVTRIDGRLVYRLDLADLLQPQNGQSDFF